MKKLIKYLFVIILILWFVRICYVIFNDKYTFKAKITAVNNEYVKFEGDSSNDEKFKGELKYYVNNDTKYYLFDDEIGYNYLVNNYIRFNATVTIKKDQIESIKLTPENNKLNIYAFFKQDTKEEDINKIKNTVSILHHVISVKLVTNSEAKEDMSSRSSLFNDLLNRLDDNPLRDYLIIEVDGNINQIVNYLKILEEVDIVNY